MVINGNLSINNCKKLQIIKNIEKINKDLDLEYNSVNFIDKIHEVSGKVTINCCKKIKEINIKKIKGNLILVDSSIIKIVSDIIEKDLIISRCKKIKSLKWIKEVRGRVFIGDSNIDDFTLKKMKSLSLLKTKIKTLPENLIIKEFLDIKYSDIETLPEKINIGGNLFLGGSSVTKDYILKHKPEIYNKCNWSL